MGSSIKDCLDSQKRLLGFWIALSVLKTMGSIIDVLKIFFIITQTWDFKGPSMLFYIRVIILINQDDNMLTCNEQSYQCDWLENQVLSKFGLISYILEWAQWMTKWKITWPNLRWPLALRCGKGRQKFKVLQRQTSLTFYGVSQNWYNMH